VSRVLRKGYLFDVNYWIPKLREMTLGDLTFMEAYRKTGRVVNVTITSTSTHSDNLVCSYRYVCECA
jgi:TAG lipase/steryl ester hydrolase/phospholipase A2/LPA acyltransferase